MTEFRSPSLLDALIPVVSLVLMLGFSVYLFGSDSSSGPNQIVLITGAAIASMVALKNGLTWSGIQEAIIDGISTAMGAILILLSVGALIGTWLMSGTVPSLIYYGLEILSPSWFYAAACIICAISSLAIGSSWTVAGTLGVALVGIAGGLGLNPAVAAGAIISGAYFGDKMSPLSDTTNLAPAVVALCWWVIPFNYPRFAIVAVAIIGIAAARAAWSWWVPVALAAQLLACNAVASPPILALAGALVVVLLTRAVPRARPWLVFAGAAAVLVLAAVAPVPPWIDSGTPWQSEWRSVLEHIDGDEEVAYAGHNLPYPMRGADGRQARQLAGGDLPGQGVGDRFQRIVAAQFERAIHRHQNRLRPRAAIAHVVK